MVGQRLWRGEVEGLGLARSKHLRLQLDLLVDYPLHDSHQNVDHH